MDSPNYLTMIRAIYRSYQYTRKYMTGECNFVIVPTYDAFIITLFGRSDQPARRYSLQVPIDIDYILVFARNSLANMRQVVVSLLRTHFRERLKRMARTHVVM